jgi:hypothetical protein
MRKLDTEIQSILNINCETIDDVMDELTGWGLELNVTYTLNYKNKNYSFYLVDSGVSDEPQYGNCPKVVDFKEIIDLTT